MIDIVIITHGNLAKELNEAAKQILHFSDDVTSICLGFELDHKACSEKIKSTLEKLDQNTKRIILTDLFGGTPSNMTIPYVKKGNIEVITGINLPMLIFLLSHKEEKSFEELCEGAQNAGKEAIFIAGNLIGTS